MLDRSFWRTTLLVMILTAPVALAAPPASNLDSAAQLGGQELSDLAIDRTGQYAIAVVTRDGTSLPSNPLGGLTGTARNDIYACNFGTPSSPRSGTGCRGLNHPSPPAGVSQQAADVITRDDRVAFAVAGPGPRVSVWFFTSETPTWYRDLDNNLLPTNVTFNADGTRLIVGAAPATGGGRIVILEGGWTTRNGNPDGRLVWDWNLTDAAGNAVRPTSLDYASRGVLAVGTTNGVVLLNPDSNKPSLDPGRITQAQSVNQVALSAAGDTVAVAASNGVFLAPVRLEGTRPIVDASGVFHRALGEGVQLVALSADGSHFAAAAGGKLSFFRRLPTSVNVAEQVGEAYDVGARISSLAYDQTGQILVVTAGDSVFGFAPGRSEPIWSFAASNATYGGVDGPLRKVRVSDTGERIILGGKTELMAYSSVVAVRGTLAPAPGGGNGTVAPGQTVPLALNVTNAGSVPDTYTFVVKTPEGWAQANAEGFSLNPEESRVARFNVTAPPGLSEGTFGIEVRIYSAVRSNLTGRQDPALAAPAFNLTVPRTVALVVELPQERIGVIRGAEQIVPVTIRNDGNAVGLVNLSIEQNLSRSGASWPLRLEQEQIEIAPNARVEVDLMLLAPDEAASGDRNVITIVAREGGHVAHRNMTAYVDALFSAELSAPNATYLLRTGDIRTIPVTIINNGNTDDAFNITYTLTPAESASDWRVTLSPEQISVPRGQSRIINVVVKPSVVQPEDATLTLRATSQSALEDSETSLPLVLVHDPTIPTDDEEIDNLLPGPQPLLVLLAVAGLALARRLRGGRA